MKKINNLIILVMVVAITSTLPSCNRGDGSSDSFQVVTKSPDGSASGQNKSRSKTNKKTKTSTGKSTSTSTKTGTKKGTPFPPVMPAPPAIGRLAFMQNGEPITRLDLMPGSSGKINLEYYGDSRFSNNGQLLISMPSNASSFITPYFSGDCLSAKMLSPNQSCTLNYSIPSDPAINVTLGDFLFTAMGQPAFNSPLKLDGSIATIRSYVVNAQANSISQCTVNPVIGRFSSCVNTGAKGLDNPQSITFNPAGNRAYIANAGNNTISQCDVDSISGIFTNCKDNKLNGVQQTLQAPCAITLNRSGTYVYIVNAKGNSITECSVNPINGEFNECIDSTITGLNDPQNFFLSKDEKHGFVANKGNNSITQCWIDPATGKLSPPVHNKNLMFIDGPTDINIVNVDVGISYAYITNFNNDAISHCGFNPLEEALTSCTDSGATGLDKPTSIAFDVAKELAFITNSGNNTITQCNLDYKRDGQLYNCINTLASTLGQPADLSFNATPITRAFVINSPMSTSHPVSTISQCAVDTKQGTFLKCSNIDLSGEIAGLNSAYDISFNPAGSIVYISNYTEGKKGQIIRCNTFKDAKKFTDCSDTGATLIDEPVKMAFNKTGTGALIANHIDKHSKDESSALTYCHVNPRTGEFSACKSTEWNPKSEVLSMAFNADDTQIYLGTTKTIHHYAINWLNGDTDQRMANIDTGIEWPSAITFNSAGTRAYIADFLLSRIHLCEVDVINGQLTQCNDSGAKGLKMPVDVHLSVSGDVAYISNQENNLISRCTIDQKTGSLSNCADSGAIGLNDPHSIVVFPSFSLGWGFDLP